MSRGIKVEKREVMGETLYIRTLSGGERAARVLDLMTQVGSKPAIIPDLGALLIVCCECTESGELIHKGENAEVEIAQNSSIAYLRDFMLEALDVSGLGEDAEEIRKNS